MEHSTYYDHDYSPVFVLDKEFNVTYFNGLAGTFLKLSPRKINGKDIKELIPLPESLWHDLKSQALSLGSVGVSSETDFLYLGDSFSFVFRLQNNGDEFLLFCNDLSVEKKLHIKYQKQVELLKESHNQLLQADKVRAIGELTAGISHEINNPLTVASGNTEILGFSLEEEDLNAQRELITSCVDNLDESLGRINEIISGMKGFLHQGQGDKKEYINLDDVIKAAVKLTSSTLKEYNIDLKFNASNGQSVVLGNQTKLEQIVINLIQNSADGIKQKGQSDGLIEIFLGKSSSGHYQTLSVVDNGAGIESKDIPKIFDSFFTTKEMGDGTGLGLSICKKIAEDHQGDLEFENSNNGARFTLKLPVIEVSSYASNDEFFSKINDVDGRKVLVVDNDATILNLCQKIFESTKYIFIGSTGGAEALDVLQKYEVDLIITDLNMPGIDGRTFVRKLRESNGSVPVFYLSSENGLKTYDADKVDLNLSGILLKPFKTEQLVNLLNKAFSNS